MHHGTICTYLHEHVHAQACIYQHTVTNFSQNQSIYFIQFCFYSQKQFGNLVEIHCCHIRYTVAINNLKIYFLFNYVYVWVWIWSCKYRHLWRVEALDLSRTGLTGKQPDVVAGDWTPQHCENSTCSLLVISPDPNFRFIDTRTNGSIPSKLASGGATFDFCVL